METSHTEYIICGKCNHIQAATVEHTAPFNTYIHYCTKCQDLITESDWQKADILPILQERLKKLQAREIELMELHAMNVGKRQREIEEESGEVIYKIDAFQTVITELNSLA